MPGLRHYYGLNQLHFITSSTYHRARVFESLRFKQSFVETLDSLRSLLRFKVIGYVLMPEHFHLLIWPSQHADPSAIIRSLKERTAKLVLKNLSAHPSSPWCARMLHRLSLPPSVHSHATYRVWQRRFYDMSVWSERKRLEKLKYMHANPVKRRLVQSPDQWPWSSFRYYSFETIPSWP